MQVCLRNGFVLERHRVWDESVGLLKESAGSRTKVKIFPMEKVGSSTKGFPWEDVRSRTTQ